VRHLQSAFIVTVLVALCLPVAQWSRGVVSLDAEKRKAAEWPGVPRTRDEVRAWPAAVEAFVQDRVGLRDAAVRSYNRLVVFGLHASPVSRVVLGRGGWLFYDSTATPGLSTVADARRSRPLPRRKVDVLADMILTRRDLVSGWGGRYLFVVVPEKASIYPEWLPAALTQVGRGKPLEQLAARLTPAPEGPFLDLTQVLWAGKQRPEVYYRTDSHWNQLGAFHGLVAIMNVLGRDHPDLVIPNVGDLAIQQSRRGGGDLATMLNLAPMFSDTLWQLSPRADLALPAFQRKLRIWVYTDSSYQVLRHVWAAYLPGVVAHPPTKLWVDEEVRDARPDIVVQLLVERRLRFDGRDPRLSL
jgi:alginate O-acetyltransferase complex protein AlgJ